MNLNQKLYITKTLVIISVLCSILSFFLVYYGKTEPYPFFHWKLYTQPLGDKQFYNDYRIYAITEKNDTLRLSNSGYKSFNQDDYYYFVTIEASNVLNKKEDRLKYKKRLKEFGHFIAPNYKEYLLVEEYFEVLNSSKNPLNFKKSIILSTK